MRTIDLMCRNCSTCNPMPVKAVGATSLGVSEPGVIVITRLSILEDDDGVTISADANFDVVCATCRKIALTVACADVARLHGSGIRDFNVRFEGVVVGKGGRLIDMYALETNQSAMEQREADIVMRQDGRVLTLEPDLLISDLRHLLALWFPA